MNPNQALWEKGDFTEIAAFMRESGQAVAASLGTTAGLRVLDLGCGDGTMPLAQHGAGAERVALDKDQYVFRSPDQDAAQFIDLFRRFYGPTMNAFDAAEKERQGGAPASTVARAGHGTQRARRRRRVHSRHVPASDGEPLAAWPKA